MALACIPGILYFVPMLNLDFIEMVYRSVAEAPSGSSHMVSSTGHPVCPSHHLQMSFYT